MLTSNPCLNVEFLIQHIFSMGKMNGVFTQSRWSQFWTTGHFSLAPQASLREHVGAGYSVTNCAQ